jgi:hypothetical protein
MIKTIILLFAVVFTISAKSAAPNLIGLQDTTDECTFMLEVCLEEKEFEREYNQMSKEDRKDMASVLSSYIEHCESAQKLCNKSMKSSKKK